MENNPKKSKAFIIAFILVLLLLIAGYFLFVKDGGIMNSSSGVAKIFSSLFTTKNPEGESKILAQAGEEIKDKNSIYVSGYVTNSESIPRILKVDVNDPNSSNPNNIYGVANQDIKIDDIGKVTITDKNKQNNKIIAEAGADIKNGDKIYISYYTKYTKQIPIIMNLTSNDPNSVKNNSVFGFSNQDIKGDNIGEVTLTNTTQSTNSFWDSFFGFLNKKVPLTVENKVAVNPQVTIENGVWKGTNPFNDPSITIKDNVWIGTNPTDGKILLDNGIWKNVDTADKTTIENGTWEKIDGVWTKIDSGRLSKLDPYSFPVITVTATPSSFEKGGISTISWTSTNATSCNAGTGNGTDITGSFKTANLTESKSYTVVCTGVNGSSSGNAFVIINGVSTFPMVTVTANPSSFEKAGTSTISWTSTNTTSCNAGEGRSTGMSGSFSTGLLVESKSYAVTCTGVTGSSSSNVFVIVMNNNNATGIIRQCSDGVDNNGDGKIDALDPNCHIGGVLTGEYVPTHFSEATSPGDGISQCSDGKDNNGDKLIDAGDPNCHIGGVLTGEYIPTHYSEATPPTPSNNLAQCSDGIDNDKDGKTDSLDLNCHEGGILAGKYISTHFSESSSPIILTNRAQCSDGKDNNGNKLIDAGDPNCHTDGDVTNSDSYLSTHYSESTPPTPSNNLAPCSDSIDNDKDGKIDALDPNCHTDSNPANPLSYVSTHYSEASSPIPPTNRAQCSDGKDNNKNSKIDALDPNCHTDGDVTNSDSYLSTHYSESTPPTPPNNLAPCSDKKDNDGDKLIDANDPQCHTDSNPANPLSYVPTHYSEATPPFPTNPQCSDGIDNNKNSKIDALDPNCHTDSNPANPLSYVPTHYSEATPPVSLNPQCSDGRDNDKDGKIDALDPNCHTDSNPANPLSYVPTHYSEAISPPPSNPQCSDGRDNDKDGKIDALDPNCHTDSNASNPASYVPTHYSEASSPILVNPQCSDGKDNDGDKLIDSADPECHTDGNASNPGSYVPTHTSEKNPIIDPNTTKVCCESFGYGAQMIKTASSYNIVPKNSCVIPVGFVGGGKNIVDNSFCEETNPDTNSQCSDKKDNDKDGKIDILDPNCHIGGVLTGEYVPTHFSESSSPTECDDTIDNDIDNLIDIKDPNCHIGGILTGEYLPAYNSESIPPTECTDTKDNDGDSFIDIKDPGCHYDGDLKKDYTPENNSESTSIISPNECLYIDKNPLEFTDEEKSQLDELLRKFYLMAPNLKTEDDINIAYSEITSYQNFSDRLSELINQCYIESGSKEKIAGTTTSKIAGIIPINKVDTPYTGPTTRWGNPWYKYSTLRGSYIDKNFDCKYVSGWFSGNGADGKTCDTYNKQLYTTAWPANCTGIKPLNLSGGHISGSDWIFGRTTLPDQIYRAGKTNGCVWNPGAYIFDMEKIVNVW